MPRKNLQSVSNLYFIFPSKIGFFWLNWPDLFWVHTKLTANSRFTQTNKGGFLSVSPRRKVMPSMTDNVRGNRFISSNWSPHFIRFISNWSPYFTRVISNWSPYFYNSTAFNFIIIDYRVFLIVRLYLDLMGDKVYLRSGCDIDFFYKFIPRA